MHNKALNSDTRTAKFFLRQNKWSSIFVKCNNSLTLTFEDLKVARVLSADIYVLWYRFFCSLKENTWKDLGS